MVIQAIATLIFLPFIMGRSGVYHLHFHASGVESRLFRKRGGSAPPSLGYTGRVDLCVRRAPRRSAANENLTIVKEQVYLWRFPPRNYVLA